jgi:hypothetical protein
MIRPELEIDPLELIMILPELVRVTPAGMSRLLPVSIVRVSPEFIVSDLVRVQMPISFHVPITVHDGSSEIA